MDSVPLKTASPLTPQELHGVGVQAESRTKSKGVRQVEPLCCCDEPLPKQLNEERAFFSAFCSRGRVHNSGEDMTWLQEQESGWSHFYKHTGGRGRVGWSEVKSPQVICQPCASSSKHVPPESSIIPPKQSYQLGTTCPNT